MRLAALLLLVAMKAGAAPFIESPKMPPTKVGDFSSQPEGFYLDVSGQRLPCATLVVKTTMTVQASCDIESLAPGIYTIYLVAVKTSNETETPSPAFRLTISKKYGGRTYQGQRVYNTSHSAVKQ